MIHINGSQTVEFLTQPLCFVTFTGVVNITVSAEAIASHASCDNEIVSVPERGRIDTVTRSLIVKVKPHQLAADVRYVVMAMGWSCLVLFFF